MVYCHYWAYRIKPFQIQIFVFFCIKPKDLSKEKESLLPPIQVLRFLFQCESVQPMLESLGGQRGALRPQLEGFEQDVSRLKEWASGLTEKRAQLQGSLTELRGAVGQIEERTSAIAKDFANKVRRLCCHRSRRNKFDEELFVPRMM